MPSKSASQHRLMEAEKAYLAGLFDGEGTVAVYESWAVSRGGRRPIWIYQVQIANCSIRGLDYVASLVGGGIARKSQGKAHWRRGYVWRCCGDDAAKFMMIIRPYVVIKAGEIDEAIRFRDLCRPRGHRQSADEIHAKQDIVVRLKEMKRAV